MSQGLIVEREGAGTRIAPPPLILLLTLLLPLDPLVLNNLHCSLRYCVFCVCLITLSLFLCSLSWFLCVLFCLMFCGFWEFLQFLAFDLVFLFLLLILGCFFLSLSSLHLFFVLQTIGVYDELGMFFCPISNYFPSRYLFLFPLFRSSIV